MSENVLIALITVIGGALVAEITTSIRNRNLQQKGIMCSLGSDIRRDCNEAIEKGSITLIELRRINENNDIYHQLGGNGHVKALIEKVNKLPIAND